MSRIFINTLLQQVDDSSHLGKKSIKSGFFALFSESFKFIIHLIQTIVLARLLNPADYGIIGMVSAITGFITMFKDLGLTTATIQKKNITEDEISNLFWVNVFLSFVLAFICVAITPLIVNFYSEDKLLQVMYANAIFMLISGFGLQHNALLTRFLRFNTLITIELIAYSCSTIVAIIMAFKGFGYWALLGNVFTKLFFSTSLYWYALKWIPKSPNFKVKIKEFLFFGGFLTGHNLIYYWTRNLDNILIGKYRGAFELGIYTKAYQFILFPLTQLMSPLRSIILPTLIKLKDDISKYQLYLYTFITLVSITLSIFSLIVLVFSEQIITLLFGNIWLASSPILKVFAISAFIQPFRYITGWHLVSMGDTKKLFNWSLKSTPFILLSFIIGIRWGAFGIAISYLIVDSIQTVLFMKIGFHGTIISFKNVINQIFSSLIYFIIGLIILYPYKLFFVDKMNNSWLFFLCGVIISLIIYVVLIFLNKKHKDIFKRIFYSVLTRS